MDLSQAKTYAQKLLFLMEKDKHNDVITLPVRKMYPMCKAILKMEEKQIDLTDAQQNMLDILNNLAKDNNEITAKIIKEKSGYESSGAVNSVVYALEKKGYITKNDDGIISVV